MIVDSMPVTSLGHQGGEEFLRGTEFLLELNFYLLANFRYLGFIRSNSVTFTELIRTHLTICSSIRLVNFYFAYVLTVYFSCAVNFLTSKQMKINIKLCQPISIIHVPFSHSNVMHVVLSLYMNFHRDILKINGSKSLPIKSFYIADTFMCRSYCTSAFTYMTNKSTKSILN